MGGQKEKEIHEKWAKTHGRWFFQTIVENPTLANKAYNEIHSAGSMDILIPKWAWLNGLAE